MEAWCLVPTAWCLVPIFIQLRTPLARMFHELVLRDHEDGRATGQPYRGIGPEAYLNGTSQGPPPEDAREDGHIRGRSKRFMKHPG
jgi:hypothetical protein